VNKNCSDAGARVRYINSRTRYRCNVFHRTATQRDVNANSGSSKCILPTVHSVFRNNSARCQRSAMFLGDFENLEK